MSKPYLETFAGLYAAACEQLAAGQRAVDRTLQSAAKYGYTEAELIAASAPSTEAESAARTAREKAAA